MKKTSLPPIFLMLSILIIILIPSVPYVHAPFKNSLKAECANGSITCVSASLPVSTSDLIILNIECFTATGIGSVTDSLGNTFTLLISQIGSSILQAVYYSFSISNGNDIVTITTGPCNGGSATPNSISYSFDTFTGISSIGNSIKQSQTINNCGGLTCTDSLAITSQATSIVYESMMMLSFANNNICASALASGSGATFSETYTCSQRLATTGIIGASLYKQLSIAGSSTFIFTYTNNAQFVTSLHILVELRTTQQTQTSVTQCYGNCGNPPITLVNANATHPINFNQSYTLFYEFQSNLNGVLQNVTTNVAKSYGNGQQIALGVYTASCSPGTTPFTIGCAGQLQPGSSIFSNLSKGKITINTQISVVTGQWIALAVSGVFSGLDLNQTNVSCTDPSQLCINGMQWSKGTIPSILSSSSSCTASGSPCNFASISSTGLWAYVNGNVIINAPIPTPSVGCQNVDLACFMSASACGLSPSNCFVGGTVYLFIYFVVFVVGITLCFSYINREYETEVHFPPSLFFLFFLLELFMFTAIGLIPQFVTIVIFIFTALGVAGYFGSHFMGRSNRSE